MTEDNARADGVHFTPQEHDVRVQRGDWVFYVRGVKQGEGFAGGLSWDGNPLSLPVLLAMQGVLTLARRPLRWKVGVVRTPSPSSWKTDRIRVVHKERLAEGEEPSRRIAELVGDVNAGAFDPG